MAQEAKEEPTKLRTKATLMWDVSCNSVAVDYSANLTRATIKAKTGNYKNIRGPFWNSGRHIINIKIIQRFKDGMGIGIIDKSFNIYDNIFVGKTEDSYSYYFNGSVYNSGKELIKCGEYKAGDIITVDIDLYNRTLNWGINGVYLTTQDTVVNIPQQVALAVNFCYKKDSVQIVQYYKM
eukprot:233375_1